MNKKDIEEIKLFFDSSNGRLLNEEILYKAIKSNKKHFKAFEQYASDVKEFYMENPDYLDPGEKIEDITNESLTINYISQLGEQLPQTAGMYA